MTQQHQHAWTDWSVVAPAWDRFRDDIEATEAALSEELIAAVSPLRGRSVLELGSGTGELARRLAGEAGPDGHVTASDSASGMVALVTRALAGVANADAARIDACDIPLASASVDAVVFRMGLMLITEPASALAEIRRVLRPGAPLAATVWGAPTDNPWLMSVGMAATIHGLIQGGPPVGPGGPFSLADPAELEKLARGAGFADVEIRVIDGVRTYADADAHFAMSSTLAPPLAAAFRAATPEQVAAVRATVADLTRQYRTDAGLAVPMRALLLIGR